MKTPVTIIAALAIAGAFSTTAQADGKNDDLEIDNLEVRDNGESLTVEGEIDGLDDDDGDVTVFLRARGDAEYRCERKGKDKIDDDEVRLSGRDKIREKDVDDDNTEFDVETRSARRRDVRDKKCKDIEVRDVEFTRFRIYIRQDGELLATKTCWFDDPTDDGKISKKDYECSRTRHWDDDWDWGDWHDDHWGEEPPGDPGELVGR